MNKPTDLRALFICLFLALGAVGLLGLSVLTVFFALVLAGSPEADTLTFFLLAGGLFLSGILVIPGAYLNMRKALHLPDDRFDIPFVNDRVLFVILVSLWFVALIIGQFVAPTLLGIWLLPFLNALAIGIPVVIFLRIALRKLKLPPARLGWSVFGLTLVTGPVLGILLEGIAFVTLIFALGLYAAFDPALSREMAHLAQVFSDSINTDSVFAAASPIFFAPGGMLALLGLLSVAVPAIEEAIKIAALWVFADHLKEPVDGFILGALAGAAFALAENLGFSSTVASDWMFTASLRASSILPHMLNSGILGWALVSAWKKRSYLVLAVGYFSVICIHGTWNAISVALWLNSLAPYVEHAPSILVNPTPFFAGWAVMILGTLAGLAYCNQVLLRGAPPQVEYNEPPLPISGDDHGHSENAD